MRTFSPEAISLGHQIKAAARNNSLDVNTYGSRHVAERVVHHLGDVLPVPFMVKGGLLFSQEVRETKGADLVSIRRLSAREINNAFKVIAPRLASEGIHIKRLSPEPQAIDIAHGNPVDRYSIEAMCGTIRGNTQLDIAYGCGPDAFPKRYLWRKLPSLMRDGPRLRARCQPLPAAAAEKFLALLLQSPTDKRVKHLADLSNMELWGDIDCREIACELSRIILWKALPLSICAERPAALDYTIVGSRFDEWQKLMAAGKTDVSLRQAHSDVCAVWSAVHSGMKNDVRAHTRFRQAEPTLADEFLARCAHKQMAYQPSPGDI